MRHPGRAAQAARSGIQVDTQARRPWASACAGATTRRTSAPSETAPLLQYLVKRLLGLIPTLALVALLVFLFVHLLPGDPARLAAGPDATPETVALVRQDLGLDKSLPEQFVRFTTGWLHGDFGRSLRTTPPV